MKARFELLDSIARFDAAGTSVTVASVSDIRYSESVYTSPLISVMDAFPTAPCFALKYIFMTLSSDAELMSRAVKNSAPSDAEAETEPS